MGFWICWYFLSLWVPNYTFQYRIHYHDATTSPPDPLTLRGGLTDKREIQESTKGHRKRWNR